MQSEYAERELTLTRPHTRQGWRSEGSLSEREREKTNEERNGFPEDKRKRKGGQTIGRKERNEIRRCERRENLHEERR
jgi:hypothetical protein